ncbi:putative endonuclease [Aquimarina intermedia]|uniref:Putative endonuclease n=2 Tax=Aquimarina intermedia TaxID=350814 RepID=A0A5S5CFU3_9FLAO|nr:GIY-YIG nuclease family protein [Aquimarina intermedia]TYP77382.1 putative endonuclease [Aquimarina intermedia]
MKMYWVYIPLCSDGFTYTGVTNNLSRRLEEHQEGKNKSCFTYKRRPVKLVFNQEFNDVEQAIFFEKKIKKWSAKKKLALADENFDLLQLLSECRNKTHANNKRND